MFSSWGAFQFSVLPFCATFPRLRADEGGSLPSFFVSLGLVGRRLAYNFPRLVDLVQSNQGTERCVVNVLLVYVPGGHCVLEGAGVVVSGRFRDNGYRYVVRNGGYVKELQGQWWGFYDCFPFFGVGFPARGRVFLGECLVFPWHFGMAVFSLSCCVRVIYAASGDGPFTSVVRRILYHRLDKVCSVDRCHEGAIERTGAVG